MFIPPLNEVLQEGQSTYSLVIAVAKKARQLNDDAQNDLIAIVDKPVSVALEKLHDGEYKIEESQELKEMHNSNVPR